MRKQSRSSRAATTVALVILAIAGLLAFSDSIQNAQRKRARAAKTQLTQPKLSPDTLNLPGGAFDPLASGSVGTVIAGSDSLAPDEKGYYVIQLNKIANDEILDRLRASGIEILQYIPNRAFYVYASGASAANAAADQDVRWMGRLLPEHKIPAILSEQLKAAKAGTAPDSIAGLQMAEAQTAVFDVGVFKGADLKTASSRIAASTGGTVRNVIDLPGNFFNVVRVEATPDSITAAAELDGVFRIDAWSRPVAEDERAAQIVAGNYSSTSVIDPPGYDPLTQFGVDGTGVTVSVVDDGIGIPGDGGFYITSANAKNGPLRGASAGALGHGHLNATIVAGSTPFSTLDPTGYNYALGVAPKSNVLNIPILRSGYVGTEANTANDTVATTGPNGVAGSISNNSWGNGENDNSYDSYAAQFDGFVRDASDAGSIDPLLIIFSAGNSGSLGLTRPKMSKNSISVGNLENLRTELSASADNMDDLSGSSSIGPAADGRIKPDLSAPGTAITGGRSGPNALFGDIGTYHRWSSGTSHAAPQVAGAAALFTQFWKAGHAGANPSPALVKAALINGAIETNGSGTAAAVPNGAEGWGRVNLKNVLNTGTAVTYINETDRLIGTGAAKMYNGNVSDPGRALRISLVWTDPPAAVDPALVNDLDLEVTVGGNTYFGNVFSGGVSVPGGTPNSIDNVENVFIPAGQSGPVSVTVRARAINGDGVLGNADLTDQHFALVVYNANVAIDSAALPVYDTPVVLGGNGILEPSECNSVNVPITNTGLVTATGVSATLTTSTPGASVFAGNSSYPDLAPGATATNQSSFLISTGGTVACLTSMDLTLTVTFAGGGSPLVYNFSMPIGRPGGTNYSFASTGGATISPGGTIVTGSNADDAVVEFTVPFAFSVYGTSVPAGSNIRLGTNGFIVINATNPAGSAGGNDYLPSGSPAFPTNKPVLFPYWDDLDMKPSVTNGGGIYTEVTGSPGSQALKIEWRARRWRDPQPLDDPDTNFAVYFHEGSANFEYVYASTGVGVNAAGGSATVGVQGAATGGIYTQYSAFSPSLSVGQMLSATIDAQVCSPGTGACVLTAAPVLVSGRVLTAQGRGIYNARVTLIDKNGRQRSVQTNSFGYFRFQDVPSGETYVLSVSARGYIFESRSIQASDNIADLTFVGIR